MGRYTRRVMPTYEYRCRDCGHTFDIVQSMNDEGLTVCPECGGVLRKVFGAPMISFKGSGFYATDHGKRSKSSEKSSEQSEAKQKDAKQGADTTSAPSSDTKSGPEKKSGDAASAAKTEPSSGSKAEPQTTSKKEQKT